MNTDLLINVMCFIIEWEKLLFLFRIIIRFLEALKYDEKKRKHSYQSIFVNDRFFKMLILS